jgi:catechol 2,3-dioxygenase-like lactoylglutathione lyase family enzyme
MIDEIDHVVLYSGDSERTIRFWREVMGCTIELEDEWRQGAMPIFRIRISRSHYLNVHPSGTVLTPRAATPAPGTLDLCFRSALSSADVARHFGEHGIDIEVGPVPRSDATGRRSTSIYVRDPDGNLVEVMSAE